MEQKLFDSERRVMEVLWEADAPLTAKEIARRLGQAVGWNKNTTYTVINKCVEKGAIERREPNFQCFPLVRREEAQAAAAAELVEKVFDGSASLLFASLLSGRQLPPEEIQRLRELVDALE